MALGKSARKEFPIFSRKVNSRRLVYLDNAATSQKPQCVLDAMSDYYKRHNGNPGRGVHTLTAEAGEEYEKAREETARFIGAKPNEIVFTCNTTESINLLSYVLPAEISHGPILLSKMEHHSNFVPWQQMSARTGRKLAFVPFDVTKPITAKNLEKINSQITPSLLTIAHASNVLGTINDVEEMARFAHENWKCPVVVDAAQSAPHMKIDVRKMNCDFLAFSGHKMLGPTGVGVLYMADGLMERLPPFMTGGGQIGRVDDTASTWADGPAKFEAGTPDVAAAVGLAEAMRYIRKIGIDKIHAHEKKLVKKTLDMLHGIDGIEVYGLPSERGRVGVISFNVNGLHAHDVGTILDRHGVEVRAGHHCAQPLMRQLNVVSTARASFYLYNDMDDITALEEGLREVKKIFSV